MEWSSALAVAAFALWLVSFLLQLGHFGTAVFDARTAIDRDAPPRFARHRSKGLFWLAPFAALVLVAFGLGVSYTARLLFDDGRPAEAAVAGLAVAALAVGGWLVVVLALTSGKKSGYHQLRRELRDLQAARVEPQLIAGIQAELAAIDSHQSLATLARSRVWRWVPVWLAIVSLVATLTATILSGRPELAWAVAGSAVLLLVTWAIARATERAAAAADSAWLAVAEKQRSDVVELLAVLEVTSTRKVAGLGDRVTRALQILRDQQG